MGKMSEKCPKEHVDTEKCLRGIHGIVGLFVLNMYKGAGVW